VCGRAGERQRPECPCRTPLPPAGATSWSSGRQPGRPGNARSHRPRRASRSLGATETGGPSPGRQMDERPGESSLGVPGSSPEHPESTAERRRNGRGNLQRSPMVETPVPGSESSSERPELPGRPPGRRRRARRRALRGDRGVGRSLPSDGVTHGGRGRTLSGGAFVYGSPARHPLRWPLPTLGARRDQRRIHAGPDGTPMPSERSVESTADRGGMGVAPANCTLNYSQGAPLHARRTGARTAV
jgi:hypothetical protein